MLRSMFLAAMAVAIPVHAGEANASKVVAFEASVRVEVDAAGRPVKVEAPQDLPEAIRDFVEKRVASWQYRPASVDGVPQAATTYVAVNACAVPVAGGYRLGVDFDGNGARYFEDRRIPPPLYPHEAQMRGTEARFVLILGIDAEGRGKLEQVEDATFSGRRGSGDFEPELRRWARTLRFDPELVAGKPVPARLRIPVTFDMAPSGVAQRKALVDELQAKARMSRECQIASGDDDAGMKPVALQPAVEVTPVPAS